MQSRHFNVITRFPLHLLLLFLLWLVCVTVVLVQLLHKERGLGWALKTGHKSTKIHELFAEATSQCFRVSVPSEPLGPTGLASLSFLIRAFVRDAAESWAEHHRESTVGCSSAAPRETLKEFLLSCSELLHVSQQLFFFFRLLFFLSLWVERKSLIFL